ncbi:MAG: ATP-binding cassette domain-containing protein [Sedimentisphaerales bacterium]|nr:ATP-binding cassette domain-containing protein [Sedimentisphaerales bacterium]
MIDAANNELALDINRISVRYDGRWVLRDFSLRLAQGEKLTLTGPSGVGKTTILRCVLGLVQPDHGAIRINGQLLNEYHVWNIRRQLAYVAQEPNLGSGPTRDVLERPFAFRANSALKNNLHRVPELFDRFLLPHHLLDKDITNLSGGEKQRIALISAILLERPIILLDEASSALDADSKRAVIDYIRQVPDLTVLAVAHDDEWQAFADRTISLTSPKVLLHE